MKHDQVGALVRSHYEGDQDRFRTTVYQIAAGLRDKSKAESLIALTKTATENATMILGRNARLVEEMPPRELRSLILPEIVVDSVSILVLEHRNRLELAAHNLKPRSRILLHGPPGNGKTSLAQAIATELRLNGYSLTLAETRSRFMGETAANIHRAMAIADNPGCMLLLDELDAIGELRSENGDGAGKESNAIVASLLQRLNGPVGGVVVAATNRLDMVDPAVVRRFDTLLALPAPSRVALTGFAAGLFDRFGWTCPDRWVPAGASFSAVEIEVEDVVRRGVLEEVGMNGSEQEDCCSRWEARQ